MLLKATMIAALAFIAALTMVVMIRSQQPQHKPHRESSANQTQQEEHGNVGENGPEDPIVKYTRWLAYFTAVLALVSAVQIGFLIHAAHTEARAARAAENAANTAKDSLEIAQRPFLFITTFEVSVFGTTLRVMPKWENSGGTPTQNMQSRVSWKIFPGAPPAEYPYPDLGADGQVDSPRNTLPAFVGPRGSSYAAPLDIPIAVVEAARNGQGRIFVWGWAEYDDVFKTAHHRTEFCNELATITGTASGSAVQTGIYFPMYGPYNSAN